MAACLIFLAVARNIMISKNQVQRVAKLARLNLTQEEIQMLQKDMSAILDYFEVLKKAKALAEKTKSIPSKNVLRTDEAIEQPKNVRHDLLLLAPNRQEGYIKVKQIL